MSEISRDELEKEIAKILKNADLSSTSSKKVRQKLEKSFGTDLTEKRKIIDELVMEYVNSKEKEESEEEDGDDDEEEEEEEEEKKPVKRPAPADKKPKKKARKESSSEVEEDGTNDSDSEGEKKKPDAKKKASKKKGSDGDSDDDWVKKQPKSKNKKAGGAKGARGKGSGYTRAYKLSPALAELMGQDEMPRHEVVKRVWAIIKEKKLYDPNNKHFAICDDALYKVIGTKRFRAFGMMKYLKSHFLG